jgi:hypothetical protein
LYSNDQNESFNVVVVAPTGLAAFNVNGLTIHIVFKIPVQKNGDKDTYYDLLKSDVKLLRHILKDTHLIIIGKSSCSSSKPI